MSSSFNNSRFYDHGLGCSLLTLSLQSQRCLLRDSLYVLLWGGLLHSMTSICTYHSSVFLGSNTSTSSTASLLTYILHWGALKTNSLNLSIIASAYMCYVQESKCFGSLSVPMPAFIGTASVRWICVMSTDHPHHLLLNDIISFYAHFYADRNSSNRR